MPITKEEALEVFGVSDLEKFENVDAFKETIEKDWLKADSAHNDPRVKSKVVGTFHRKGAKEISELNNSLELGLEIDDKADVLALIPKLAEALKPKFDGIKELQEKVKTAAPAEVLAEFERKDKEREKKLAASEKGWKEAQAKYDELFNSVQTREKTAKIDGEWDSAVKAIPFSPQVDELKKAGFLAIARQKYQIVLDDEQKPYLANAKGEPIMHPKKAGERLPLSEALKTEAETLKLIGVNPHGNKPVAGPIRTTPPQDQQQTQFGRRERKPAPRLM